ncbi:MAG: hypothetical protein M0T84_04565 [Betaproteobacteria bacterium]|nr:hypothetical protein [Betaproteobacteria bacterium]
MTKNNKGRYRWNGATPNVSDSPNHTPIRTRATGVIVRIAVWGLIPGSLADWLTQRGGLRHA